MSFHIVSVCPRCGSRNMSPEIRPDNAMQFETALSILVPLELMKSDLGAGCQECDPDLPKSRTATEGRLRAIWDGKAGS
jgi:hypothetical protein